MEEFYSSFHGESHAIRKSPQLSSLYSSIQFNSIFFI